ncbi:3-oxoacyl-[acyl-carrier protein] reductase [hydrothermal vent metagenome]|uniref:3-oxoacyl-[acyl-carrier protein] reductase n=1 Tax=hydrothermal vent metagenome TaxID=652676 RepID=A0A3B0UIB5_9ZZZZ
MRFSEKVVLVTGSTQGIGKEIAVSFAKEGAVVVILGRNEDLARQNKEELIDQGLKAEYFACDVTNQKNVQEIVNKVLDKYKTIDILINNAGITKDNLLLRMSESDWDEVMNVNLKGLFNCTKVVTKVMLKARKGRIVNVSSVIGIIGNVGQANYAASKAGIIGFTKSISQEIASRSITVNAVAPGFIETSMTNQLSEKAKEEIIKKIPLGKIGTAKNVADACLFLSSDEASYITGQTIIIDGGYAT